MQLAQDMLIELCYCTCHAAPNGCENDILCSYNVRNKFNFMKKTHCLKPLLSLRLASQSRLRLSKQSVIQLLSQCN